MKMTQNEFKSRWDKTFDIDSFDKRDEAQEELLREYNSGLEVGDKAHVMLYSDVEPVTVIKRTKTTVTVRYDKAKRNPNWKPEWITGGFSAICTNIEDQQWIIEDDEEGRLEKFYWSTKMNCFVHNGLRLKPCWRKYYDYNF